MERYISERHAQEVMSTLICDCIRDKKIPTYDDVANALLTCPTVVRCKDCKHRGYEEPNNMVYCPQFAGGSVPENSFCSMWEKRIRCQ